MIVDAHPQIYSSDKARYPTSDHPWQPGEPAAVGGLKARVDAAGVGRAARGGRVREVDRGAAAAGHCSTRPGKEVMGPRA